MRVGQLHLTSDLTGNCQLEIGVSESNIALIGSIGVYKPDLEKGFGGNFVDGKNVSDCGSSGNGTDKVEIKDCISAINVEFKE